MSPKKHQTASKVYEKTKLVDLHWQSYNYRKLENCLFFWGGSNQNTKLLALVRTAFDSLARKSYYSLSFALLCYCDFLLNIPS